MTPNGQRLKKRGSGARRPERRSEGIARTAGGGLYGLATFGLRQVHSLGACLANVAPVVDGKRADSPASRVACGRTPIGSPPVAGGHASVNFGRKPSRVAI